ncbi:MAG: HD domain-containing phosphohydrolase [Halanaerobiales bacterium]
MKGLIKSIIIVIFIFFLLPNHQLIAAENFFYGNQVLENHGSIMMLIEADSGIIVDINQAAVNFYGYSKEELRGMYIQDLNTLSENEVAEERKAAVTEERNYFIFPHQLADGEIRTVEVYSYPYNDNGKLILFSIINDISARIAAEEEVSRQTARLKRAEMITGLGHWEFHLSDNKVVYSEGAAEIYGIEKEYTIDEMQEIPLPEYRKNLDQALQELINNQSNYDVEFQIKRPSDGKIIDIHSIGEYNRVDNIVFGTIHDISNYKQAKLALVEQKNLVIMGIIIFALIQFFIILILIKNIKKRKSSEKEIRRISYEDKLTGLYNRAFMEKKLKEVNNKGETPVSIIMGDVNGLKLTNDTYGHNSGDKLLKTIADILRDSCRSEDIIARWGGDEFVILLPETNSDVAEEIVQRINNDAEEQYQDLIPISISLGYAVKEYSFQDIFAVLQKAEANMYKEKSVERVEVRNKIKDNICEKLAEETSEDKKHISRMQELAEKFAEDLALDDKEKNRLEKLINVHDIGKIAVPFDILNKKGELSKKEKELYKSHPEVGYRIAYSIDELVPVAEEILAHHEYWDGSGYPKGLKGEEIPLLARILNIIESYDFLTNEEMNEKPLSNREAIEEMKKDAGTKYDPDLFKHFQNLNK